MGATQSTTSDRDGSTAAHNRTTTTVTTLPVDEAAFPNEPVALYRLADAAEAALQTTAASAATTATTATSTTPHPSALLAQYAVQTQWYSRGRMLKTFAIASRQTNRPDDRSNHSGHGHTRSTMNSSNNNNNSGTTNAAPQHQLPRAVLKAAWVLEYNNNNGNNSADHNSNEEEDWISQQAVELDRLRTATRPLAHTLSVLHWFVGDARPVPRSVVAPEHGRRRRRHRGGGSGGGGGGGGMESNATSSHNDDTIGAWSPTSLSATPSFASAVSATLPTPPSLLATATGSNVATANHNHNHNSSATATTTTPTSCRAVCLLRPHVATTLADRLVTRPWLTAPEQLWIAAQLVWAVQELHETPSGPKDGPPLVHGSLSAENVGLSSLHWVWLLDIGASTYKRGSAALADDDPSEYLYYCAPPTRHGAGTTASSGAGGGVTPSTAKTASGGGGGGGFEEGGCYVAPERFVSETSDGGTTPLSQPGVLPPGSSSCSFSSTAADSTTTITPELTPAMDIFSTGCILTELFLNGERCFDLGDLMEYRRTGQCASLTQKLQKIERSSVRAACRHMLALDPAQRLSAAEYAARLDLPPCFARLHRLVRRLTVPVEQDATPVGKATENSDDDVKNHETGDDYRIDTVAPDARMAVLAAEYGDVLYETMGVRDDKGRAYFAKVLGPTVATVLGAGRDGEGSVKAPATKRENDKDEEEKKESDPPFGSPEQTNALLAEVEALLKDLQSDYIEDPVVEAPEATVTVVVNSNEDESTKSQTETVERSDMCKGSLLIFLQLVLSTIRHVQRPASKIVGLELIRLLSLHSSDEARLQRIVPVTVSLLEDQDPLVRAFACQVVTFTMDMVDTFPPSDSNIFSQYIFKRVSPMISDQALVVRLAFARCITTLAETAHRFLDISHAVRLYEAIGNGGTSGTMSRDGNEEDADAVVFGNQVAKLLDPTSPSDEMMPIQSEALSAIGAKLLIKNTYSDEVAGLQETILRWIIHVATDQTEHASLPKRALLRNLSGLCTFFGREGVLSYILPQILAFLNERQDWELRATLFQYLPAVCQSIGRASTEEFVLPCLEIGLVDSEERVICCALMCLSRIVELGLLSRPTIVGSAIDHKQKVQSPSILKQYGPLLLHPSEDVRHHAVAAFSVVCHKVGLPDCGAFVIPNLCPFFRFYPSPEYLDSALALQECLKKPWSRERMRTTLHEIQHERKTTHTLGAWTSIGVFSTSNTTQTSEDVSVDEAANVNEDPEEQAMREYLGMLVRHGTQSLFQDRSLSKKSSSGLQIGIEGSVKLAQNIMFPRQNGRYRKDSLPLWYASLRDIAEIRKTGVTEASSIRSVSALGYVYGLSIMGPAGGTTESIVGAADDSRSCVNDATENILLSTESKCIEAAFTGEWGSEATLQPDIVDTSLLVTKLKALNVPPLSADLGDPIVASPFMRGLSAKDNSAAADWKPKPKTLMATSCPISGHTAPVVRLAVSVDQKFFVSGSHDGSCRVWDIAKVEKSAGVLESSVTYADHSASHPTRINDVAMLERSYSVVSGDSDGMVHIWRVDLVSASGSSSMSEQTRSQAQPRVAGSTTLRRVTSGEGEILAVSHFNSASASVVVYATQRGHIHSWDLRCATEPFVFSHSPDLGYLSSMALGGDRNWIVSGTSRGYISIWDIRFQQCVKLWRHSRNSSISRLATSSVAPPQQWGKPLTAGDMRPFIFAASGNNECAMFDVTCGDCTECFRSVEGDNSNFNAIVEDPPHLLDVSMSHRSRQGVVKPSCAIDNASPSTYHTSATSINCMVGSIGNSHNSYLITGGGDGKMRFWDFSTPSKCSVMGIQSHTHPRSSFERIDFDSQRRLMLCRQAQGHSGSGTISGNTFSGLKKPDYGHNDSIQDVKVIDNRALVSCSRDCTVKVWR